MDQAIPVKITPPSGGRKWARRAGLAIAALLAAIAILAAVVIGPLLLAPNKYEGVPSIEASSNYRDTELITAAWQLPVARRYRSGGFEFQANPSFCGPTSLANLLKSLGAKTDQKAVIDDTELEPWFGILIGGLTIDELASLAKRRVPGTVGIVRDPDLSEFRSWLRRSNDSRYRIVANFHRGPLFGRGHGHFSPVLGYLEKEDLVLVGDVNEDYRPFLVSSERLWQATDTVDEETGKERGLIVVKVA